MFWGLPDSKSTSVLQIDAEDNRGKPSALLRGHSKYTILRIFLGVLVFTSCILLLLSVLNPRYSKSKVLQASAILIGISIFFYILTQRISTLQYRRSIAVLFAFGIGAGACYYFWERVSYYHNNQTSPIMRTYSKKVLIDDLPDSHLSLAYSVPSGGWSSNNGLLPQQIGDIERMVDARAFLVPSHYRWRKRIMLPDRNVNITCGFKEAEYMYAEHSWRCSIRINWSGMASRLNCEPIPLEISDRWRCAMFSFQFTLNRAYIRQKGISFRSSFITIGTMENGHPTIAVDQRIAFFRYQNMFGRSWTSQMIPSWLQKVNGGYSMYLQEMGTQQSDDTQYYPQKPLTVNGTEMACCFLFFLYLAAGEGPFIDVQVEEEMYTYEFSDLLTACLAFFTAMLNLFTLIFPNTLPFRRFIFDDGEVNKMS